MSSMPSTTASPANESINAATSNTTTAKPTQIVASGRVKLEGKRHGSLLDTIKKLPNDKITLDDDDGDDAQNTSRTETIFRVKRKRADPPLATFIIETLLDKKSKVVSDLAHQMSGLSTENSTSKPKDTKEANQRRLLRFMSTFETKQDVVHRASTLRTKLDSTKTSIKKSTTLDHKSLSTHVRESKLAKSKEARLTDVQQHRHKRVGNNLLPPMPKAKGATRRSQDNLDAPPVVRSKREVLAAKEAKMETSKLRIVDLELDENRELRQIIASKQKLTLNGKPLIRESTGPAPGAPLSEDGEYVFDVYYMDDDHEVTTDEVNSQKVVKLESYNEEIDFVNEYDSSDDSDPYADEDPDSNDEDHYANDYPDEPDDDLDEDIDPYDDDDDPAVRRSRHMGTFAYDPYAEDGDDSEDDEDYSQYGQLAEARKQFHHYWTKNFKQYYV